MLERRVFCSFKGPIPGGLSHAAHVNYNVFSAARCVIGMTSGKSISVPMIMLM
jgi:hypothetical protein